MAGKNKHFADDGWAVWIDGEDTSTIYLNDWLSPHSKSYIDIGVHIRGIKESTGLNIYIPFEVSKEEVEDISLLLGDEKVLRAIFSTVCIVDYKKNQCTSEIAYNGKTMDIVHISQCEYELKKISDGTLLQVSFENLQQYVANDEAYFLFRIPHKSFDRIFESNINVAGALERLRDLITTPVISERYAYSVRINEARLLPPEINRIGAFHRQKLKKAVVAISISEDYEINDSACYRVHRVEEDLYKNYAVKDFDCSNAITYQWNKSREQGKKAQYNFNVVISRDSVSKSSMLIYMILIVIIGSGGSALWDLIKYIWGNM